MALTVLIIDDDPALRQVLAYNLKNAGYDISTAIDGQTGLEMARAIVPDIVMLDLMLPVIDGLDVCKKLRQGAATKNIIIVMLTARSEETDEILGFALGADDYMTKPFSVKILLERLKSLQRRVTKQSVDHTIRIRGVSLDESAYTVKVDGKPVLLTLSEFRILELLMKQPGRVFKREDIVAGALRDDMAMERTVDVHIRAIRTKFGDRKGVIGTVRGVGYRFNDDNDDLGDEE